VKEALRAIPLFSDLSDEDLAELAKGIRPVGLAAGELLFAEGDEGDLAYVITGGDVEIFKMSGKREVLLAVRGEGTVIGEMALLEAKPRNASVRARSDVEMLAIGKEQLDALLATSASASRALFQQMLSRLRQNEGQLRQSERMAQLGTLTAGLAHELNNPAAAVRRGADQLREAIAEYGAKIASLAAAGIDPGDPRLPGLLGAQRTVPEPLDALGRSDLEDELEDLLTDLGVAEPWNLVPELVDAGLRSEDVTTLSDAFGPAASEVLRARAAAASAFALLYEVEEGAARLSAIVGALKSYSYLDQAPIQEIDVTKGLDDTLLILKSKLKGIEVVKEYAEDLPSIEAYGSELNQVWTNLLDNAAYALTDAQTPSPRVVVRALRRGSEVVVEVEDNGPGIPDDVQARVFDSFFTTKPPGSGTGLGLDISYGIVVNKHAGDLTVESRPGRTVFRAVLPIEHEE
jgi:signal transduction histidine kinase